MEKSRFTVEILHNNKLNLINTLYGSIVELNEENQGKYEDILCNRNLEKNKEEIDLLLQMGILVENEEDESQEIEQLHKSLESGEDTLQLVILTTTACNMQCTYCFEHLNPVYPKPENAADVMQFIIERYQKHPFQKLSVTWFGGEPLLNMKYIREISDKAIRFTTEKDLKYDAFMITNGTLLTYDIAHELKEKWKVSALQITVDGMRKQHNMRRPYGSKDGFSIIMNNIKEVHKEIQIVLRINVDKDNIDEVEDLLKYLSACGDLKDDIIIDFGKVVGNEPTCMTFSEFESEKIKLNRMLKKYGFHYTLKQFSLKGNLISCSVLTDNAFVIYPNGDLYKCYEVAGKKEFCIGNIRNFNENYKNKISENFQLNEKCRSCSKLPLCNKHICPYQYHQDMIQCTYTDENLCEIIGIIREESYV